MWRKALFLVVLVGAVAMWASWMSRGLSGPRQPTPVPGAPTDAELLGALRDGGPVELFSIDPGEMGPRYQGRKVLGSVKLEGEEKLQVAEAVIRGIEESNGMEAGCFDPHHGIVAGRYVMIICYQCLQVYVWKMAVGEKVDFDQGGGVHRKWLTTGAPAGVLDSILDKHHVRR